MKREYLEFLLCPKCGSESLEVKSQESVSRIREGSLHCPECLAIYPIQNYIPRFSVSTSYADSFGPQWRSFARSQLDTERATESTIRFDSEIGWQEDDLEGKTVVEFGSGAGRFVDVVLKRNARLVVGLDATDAVDAAQTNLGDRENGFFVQGDIFCSPYRSSCFDFGYSVGVLRHTPEPEESFRILAKVIKPPGNIGLSLYDISLYARPNRNSFKVVTLELLWALNMWRCEVFRAVTTRVPGPAFLMYCKTVVPMLHYLNKIPVLRYFGTCFHQPAIAICR